MRLQSYDFSVILRAIRHKKQTECPRNLEYSATIRIFAVENKYIMKQEINPKDTNRAIAFELWTTLPISFQFHHAQMDGSHAARFLEELQKTINTYEYDI